MSYWLNWSHAKEEERRRYEAHLIEQGMPSEVAAGVANGDYVLPLIGQPSAPFYPCGEEDIIDAYEGIEDGDFYSVGSSNVSRY